jgi:hypothetical protein
MATVKGLPVEFANGAVTSAFQYQVALGSLSAPKDSRMDAFVLGPENAIPGAGIWITALEIIGAVAGATPAGGPADNGKGNWTWS